MSTVKFSCNSVSPKAEPFPHFWEHTVGSGHAGLALRADWQRQLARCRSELGFKHVRFHGILSSDMGTVTKQNNKLIYSFYNANKIFDFLLSIDMRPFVELSFMPPALASKKKTVFFYNGNVTPPENFDEWEEFISAIVKNWVERYGLQEVARWFFEVWNEPNLKAFWTASQEQYFRLYQSTQKAVKAVHSKLKVGGPATANNGWIPEFLDFCEKSKTPVDFISTHHYPTDAFGKPGDDTKTQLAKSHRSVLREEASKVKSESQGKPLYYTEWSTSSNPFDPLHDAPYAAAFITKTVMEARNLVEGYSYWTFSDIFDENYFSSGPFHGGFGLVNIYGVPKPAYRAYQLMHHLGDEILTVEGSHSTVDLWCTRTGSILKVICTNTALPRHKIKKEKVSLKIKGVKKFRHSYIERIDEDHSNAPKAWHDLGKPAYPTPEQVTRLEVASSLIKSPLKTTHLGDTATVEFDMPIQGTACLTLEQS